MEAKDTVMNDEQLCQIYDQWEEWDTQAELASLMVKAQAEITFKAAKDEDIGIIRDTYNRAYEKGEQAGIKKMVDEGIEMIMGLLPEYFDYSQDYIIVPKTKLKEWGL